MAVLHQALNGHTVSIDVVGMELSPLFNSYADVFIGDQLYQFASGNAGFADRYAEYLQSPLTEEYAFQDGKLRVGHVQTMNRFGRPSVKRAVAAWNGSRFSLFTSLNLDEGTAALISLLNALALQEAESGLIIHPRDPGQTRLRKIPRLVKWIDGVGVLDVEPLTPEVTRQLPPYRGRSTPGGELFVDRREAQTVGERVKPATNIYVLVTPTARCSIGPDSRVLEPVLLERIARVRVEWRG